MGNFNSVLVFDKVKFEEKERERVEQRSGQVVEVIINPKPNEILFS